jgi:hypothetical protein
MIHPPRCMFTCTIHLQVFPTEYSSRSLTFGPFTYDYTAKIGGVNATNSTLGADAEVVCITGLKDQVRGGAAVAAGYELTVGMTGSFCERQTLHNSLSFLLASTNSWRSRFSHKAIRRWLGPHLSSRERMCIAQVRISFFICC